MRIKKCAVSHFKNISFSFISLILLSACGGGGGSDSVAGNGGDDNPPVVPKVQTLTGGGVKGPLANADVAVYAFDASQPGFKGALMDSATTDNSAKIINLALPLPLAPPYIMEFTSAPGVTTDITTGQFPIISTLRTVLTQSLLDTGEPVYATPLTTMATDISIGNADSNAAPYTGNGDGSTTAAELVNALPVAAAQLASTLGFGADVDFFNTPPLIDSTTTSVADQTAVAQYRTAIEALTAVVFELSQNSASPAVSADVMLNELTADLMDGVIDGTVNGSASTVIDNTVLTALSTMTPATLPIPGSDNGAGQPLTVDDVEALLVSEQSITGSTTDTSALSSIVFTPQTPRLNPDTDLDTVANTIDNCPVDKNQNQADSNNNGVGDVCDSSPVAVTDNISVNEGAAVSVIDGGASSVLANDSDVENDTLNATLSGDVSNGSLTLNADGTFSYTHDGSETISDSFTYRANDGSSNSGITTVTISITLQNDAPVATADNNSVLEDSSSNTATGNVLANDNDADGPSLTVSNAAALNNTGSYGTLSISADGSYSYLLDNSNSSVDALNTGETLTDTFNYTVSDGSLSDSSTLVITITGVTDVVAGTVDISGVWVVTSTVTSDTPVDCAGGVGDVDATAVTITQAGNALTVKAVSGATLTGTINTVTGDFDLPTGSLSGMEADLTDLANAGTLVSWQDSFIVSGTGVTGTSLNGTMSTTETTNGATDCTYSQSFTANFVYKPNGSEVFNGVYAFESFQKRNTLSSSGSNQEIVLQSDTLDMEFTATDVTVYLPFLPSPNVAINFLNSSFDPATGFFTFTADIKVKSDTNGSPLTIEESEKSGMVFSGIFLKDPAIDGGSNGLPVMLFSTYNYQVEYKRDFDAGGTVNLAKNSVELGYSKRLDTFSRTRTKLVKKADLSNETQIVMGLNNPPIKRVDSNSKLFIEVLNGAKNVLCSAPFFTNGSVEGRYMAFEKLPFSSSNFLTTKFRGSTYNRIRCNTNDAITGNDQVFDGNDYTVRILDTGANGNNDNGGVDDVITFITTETAGVVPQADRYTQVIAVTDIVVDGVSVYAQTGDNILLPGYYNVNGSTMMDVSWPAHPEGADSYLLFVEAFDDDDWNVLYAAKSTNSITNVNVGKAGNQARTLRLVARKDVSSNGARALAESRRVLISNGIMGAFSIDLGDSIDPAYKNMQITLLGGFDSTISTCIVANNPNMSCNAASSVIDFNNDIVSLNMTDDTGTLVAGAGNTFTLELNFRGRGSATAVVTSPDVITGLPASASGATTSATLIP